MDNKNLLIIDKKTFEIKMLNNLHEAELILNISQLNQKCENIYDFYELYKNNEFFKLEIIDGTIVDIKNKMTINSLNLSEFKKLGIINKLDYNTYGISSDGVVVNFNKNYIMQQKKASDNYYVVHLTVNNISKHIKVHRLVAKYFLPNGEKYYYDSSYVVDHIDNNKHNNNVKNLQWITCRENTKKSCNIEVVKIDNSGIVIDIFDSKEDATKDAIKGTTNTTFDLYRNKENPTKAPNGFYYRERNGENINDIIRIKNNRDKKLIKANLKGNILKIYNSTKEAMADNSLSSLNMSIEFQRKNNRNVDRSLYDKNIVKLHDFLWKYLDNETINDNILL